MLIWQAIRAANRRDLYVVPAVNVKISTAARTALIPDVVVLDTRPVELIFEPERMALAVEVWSPANSLREWDTKMAAYALAGVRYFWAVELRDNEAIVIAYELRRDGYVEVVTARPGWPTTIRASPVPIVLNASDLTP